MVNKNISKNKKVEEKSKLSEFFNNEPTNNNDSLNSFLLTVFQIVI